MLVLARKRDQTILIDNGRITVKVTSIKGAVVRLAIDAPREVIIRRGELPRLDDAGEAAGAIDPAADAA